MFPLIAGYVLGQRAAPRAAGLGVISDSMRGSAAITEVDALDDRFSRLLLVTEAMWTLLKKDGHSDEELAALIAELDGSDGHADFRKTISPLTCKSCGSKVAAGLTKCQICGTETGVVPGPLDGI